MKKNICLYALSLIILPISTISACIGSHQYANVCNSLSNKNNNEGENLVSYDPNFLNKSEAQKNDEAFEYINQRTFSIMAKQGRYFTAGTCWLFYHETEFTYYAMTNLHVSYGVDQMVDEGYSLYLGYQSNDEALESNEAHLLKTDSGEEVISNKFFHIQNENCKTLFNERWNNSWYLDMTILKINLADAYNNEQLNSKGKYELKTRLDALNNGLTKNYLVDFINPQTKADSSLEYYIGGYPWKDSAENLYYKDVLGDPAGTKYRFDKTNMEPCELSNRNINNLKYELAERSGLYSANSWYMSKNKFYNSNPFKCGSGASGSMCLVGTPTGLKVSSIYWGGSLPSDGSYFLPCTQTFAINWTDKNNFVEDFMKYSHQQGDTKTIHDFTYSDLPAKDDPIEWKDLYTYFIIMGGILLVLITYYIVSMILKKKKEKDEIDKSRGTIGGEPIIIRPMDDSNKSI